MGDKELDVRSDPDFISAMETYCLFGEECVQSHEEDIIKQIAHHLARR